MSTNTEQQTPAQARLEAMRAEAAKIAAGESNASKPTAPTVRVGDTVHAVATGMTIVRTTSMWGGRPALALTKGDSFTVDAEMLAADVDRHGNPGWSAIVHDPDAQLAKWGRVYLAPGAAPSDLPRWEYGDSQWSADREEARKAAHAETDPQRRAQALRRVNEVYGPAPTTSTVHAIIRADRAYDEQQQRIAASAAAGVPNIGPSSAGRE